MCAFAQHLDLNKGLAWREIRRCQKLWSDSDDKMAWFGKINDSLGISPIQEASKNSGISPIEEASKKRKREQSDNDDHDTERTDSKRDGTGRAKKAKLQAAEPGKPEPAVTTRQGSTFSAKNPSSMLEDEVRKPGKKGKQKKKRAAAQRAEEVANQMHSNISQGPEESRTNVPIAGQKEQINLDPLRPREMVQPGPENPNDQLVEVFDDKMDIGSDQEARINETKESSMTRKILKSQRRRAKLERKRERKRAAQEIEAGMGEKGTANPPDTQLSSAEQGFEQVEKLQVNPPETQLSSAEQVFEQVEKLQVNPPEPQMSSAEQGFEQVEQLQSEQQVSPQDFHSPMIQ